MVQPYNYAIGFDVPPPQPVFTQAAGNIAQMIMAGRAVQQKRQEEATAAAAQAEERMRFGADVRAWRQGGATIEGFVDLVARYPGAKQTLESMQKAISEDERNTQASVYKPIYGALSGGNPELALEFIDERLGALQRADQPGRYAAEIKYIQGLRKTLDGGGDILEGIKPENVNAALGVLIPKMAELSGTSEPDKLMASLSELPFARQREATAVETAKAKAEQEKTKAEVEAATAMKKAITEISKDEAAAGEAWARVRNMKDRLALDWAEFRDKQAARAQQTQELQNSAPEIQSPQKQAINAHDTTSSALAASAEQLEGLAKRFEQANIPSGKRREINELIKGFFGTEDANSVLLNNYTDTKNTGALAKLRGTGQISNFELQTFSKGWPAASAKPETIAAYLRGAAKASKFASALEASKSNWMSQNGGILGVASREFTVLGIPVRRGDSYADFEQRMSANLAKQLFPNQAPNEQARNRSLGLTE